MAAKVRIRPVAQQDVVELGAYLGRDDVHVADRFLDAIDMTFDFYAQQPLLAAEYPTKNRRLRGVRVFRVKGFPNHLAFYLPQPDGVEIIRVLHAARDIDVALDDQ